MPLGEPVTRRLFLVRHGPTHQTAFTGWRDVPADLSDTAAVARMRDHLPLDAPVISSDLRRAVATADAIAGSRPRLPHDTALREFDFGAWDGLAFEDAAARDPALSHRFWKTPGDAAPPGGESWNAVTARVNAAISYYLNAHSSDLVVVAHLGVILCHVATATGQPPKRMINRMIAPLAVTELHEAPHGWSLAAFNHTP